MECREINKGHFFENLMQTGRERDRVVTEEYKDKKGFSPWREPGEVTEIEKNGPAGRERKVQGNEKRIKSGIKAKAVGIR